VARALQSGQYFQCLFAETHFNELSIFLEDYIQEPD